MPCEAFIAAATQAQQALPRGAHPDVAIAVARQKQRIERCVSQPAQDWVQFPAGNPKNALGAAIRNH
jgi:hypothetical protein